MQAGKQAREQTPQAKSSRLSSSSKLSVLGFEGNVKRGLTKRKKCGRMRIPLCGGVFVVPGNLCVKSSSSDTLGRSALPLEREASFHPVPAKITEIREISIRRCRTMRVKITLACTECKRRNYVSKKNKKNDPDRIEMKKHCRFCNKHTLHKETK